MADPPRGRGPEQGTPEYDWLYGQGNSTEEPTQVIRSGQPEPTRVLPVGPPPPSPTPARAASRRSGPPPAPPAPPAHSAYSAPPPRPPRRRPRFRLRWLKLLVLAWLIFLVAVPIWSWQRVDRVDSFPGGDRPADQDGTTYLIVGSDSRADLTPEERKRLGTGGDVGQRTDTILLLHIGSGPNLLLSIPRDSIVNVPGHGETKINAAFAYGGAKLLVQTIEEATGIRIDHYVEIGLGGFVGVVDAVGGIEVCPREAIKDPLAKIDIKKGCQEVDGKTALGYARSRHTSRLGDIDRARRQREVVSAVGNKAVSPWSVLNPIRYYRLNTAMPGFVATSEGTGPIDLARFAFAMTRVDGANGLTCGVPISDLAVHWDRERADELFAHIIADETDRIADSLCTPTGLP